MQRWLFICIIYKIAHYTDEQLVVTVAGAASTTGCRHWINTIKLDQDPKTVKSHELNQMVPASNDNLTEEDASENSGDNAPKASGDNQSFNDNAKQSSDDEHEKLDATLEEDELSDGTSDGSQSVSHGSSHEFKEKSGEAEIYLLKMPEHSQETPENKARKIRNWNRWVSEITRGNFVEIMGTNPHTYQPDAYNDLGRRFVPQYYYTEVNESTAYAPAGQEIVPIKAPKEVVSLVAKDSALKVAKQPKNMKDEMLEKTLLRTGEFWNGVWKEDATPKLALRTSNKNPILSVVKAKIKPGSEFYDLVARMKKISPRLLYIINEEKDGF